MNHTETLRSLRASLSEVIVGQSHLIDSLLIALLADGHLLVEGAPGLAKTKAIKALADRIEGDFQRIQFTPDLLPADITGTEIFRPEEGTFKFQPGPIFHNLVLADEINRAPAKVQSALLEAMAEGQVSAAGTTYNLEPLFLVMATQNPIEQEGTYPLPEAQLDRFLMHIKIDYPKSDAEKRILQLVRQENLRTHHQLHNQQQDNQKPAQRHKLSQDDIFKARESVLKLKLSETVEEYIVQLVIATRQPQRYNDDLARWIQYGASPRGTIALERCARAHAWLQGRDYVSPDDVQAVMHDTLRHRIISSFEAEASGMTTDRIINEIIRAVPVA
jgi:MoxR-like ATPase